MKFRYRLDRCDVSDPAKLVDFRKFIVRCDKLLKDHKRGIWDQLISLLLFERMHRLLREAARLNPAILENYLFWNFLDSGYAAIVTSGIRRLMSNAKNDISIKQLIDEIEKNRELFSRENYVCFDGYPFDTGPLKKKHDEKIFKALRNRPHNEGVFHRLPMTGRGAWFRADMAHRQLDKISGTSERRRKRSDVMLKRTIDNLKKRLKACDKIIYATNKVFAHADAKISPRRRMKILSNLTYSEIERSLKALSEVVAVLSSVILQVGHNSCVATTLLDVTQALDSGLIDNEQRRELRKFWRDQSDSMAKWADADWLLKPKKGPVLAGD